MQTSTKALVTCLAVAISSVSFFSCTREINTGLKEYNANDQDILFANVLSVSNYTEVSLAKLDTAKGSDSAVKVYANMMITDHTTADSMLNSVAFPLGLATPDTLDNEHLALRAQLDTLSGRAFDSVYIHSQVADHTSAIALCTTEVQKGQQTQLIALAQLLLPTLQEHLDKATTLAAGF